MFQEAISAEAAPRTAVCRLTEYMQGSRLCVSEAIRAERCSLVRGEPLTMFSFCCNLSVISFFSCYILCIPSVLLLKYTGGGPGGETSTGERWRAAVHGQQLEGRR